MSTTSQQILFIDPAIGDTASFLAQIDPSIEVILLSADQNGLEQIAQALAGRTGVDAVHIVSHGGAGYLQLGSGTLDQSGLSAQADALATISGALSEDADLLLYGCDVAAGDAGAAFISALAAATGADVAASVDATGPALLGGDGQLETSAGTIDAEVLSLIGIENLLSAPTNDGFENNLTGWTTSDAVIGTGGLYATGGPDWTVNPYGTKMAVVQPAGPSGEKTGTYDTLGLGSAARTYLDGRFPTPTNYGYIYTTVTLAAGEEFSMAWNYVATDYSPYNDASVVTFVNTTNTADLSMQIKPGADSNFSGGQVGILGATVAGTGNYVTGNYGSTGWQVVTLRAGQAGTYKLGFAVFNLGDTILSPYLFVDQAQGTTLKDGTPFSPIPAPAVQPPPPVTNAAPTFSATTHTNGSTLTDTANDDSFATLTGQVNASDSNGDALTFAISGATSGTTVKTGTYGTFTITNASTGAFTYTPNDAAIEGRKTSVTESFTVTVSDGKGGTASTTVTFTLAGANDTTAFSGTTSGALTEDSGTYVVSGTVSATDRDTGDATITASAATSVYGTFIVNAAGQWTYTLNNGSAAVQSLTEGQTVNDTFYVGTAGGSSQAVTITLTGANDRPTLSANAALLTQVEDSTDNTATSIATLLGGRFGDVDAGATFAGVLISGNAATAAQGEWQYQLSGSSSWVAIADTGLTSTNALALSASTLVRFVPAPNYNGTPGALSVYATDNVYAGGFSTGTEVFADVAAGGVSTSGRSVSITITAVNDAPVLGADVSIGLTETAAVDSTASMQTAAGAADPVVALTGTLSATDVDNAANTLSYSILGGQAGIDAESGLTVVQGSYGRLTLDPTTGDWTYAPTNTTAINALEAGEVGVETFSFKVTDSAGASDTQSLTVSITGTNDTPELNAVIDAQSFSGAGSWTYQIPAATFTDAEGTGLSYTVEVVGVDSVAVTPYTIGAATQATDLALASSWLVFNEATRTFSGDPSVDWNDKSLTLRVTATDGLNASVSTTFSLNLTDTGNQPPVVDHPLTWHAENAPREVTTVSFTEALGGQTLTFNGTTTTLGSAATGAQVASALNTAFDAALSANYTADIKAGAGNENVLVLTADTAGARSDFSNGTVNIDGGSYTVNVVTEGVTAVAEQTDVQFRAITGATSLTLEGRTLDITGLNASQIASLVASDLNTNSTAWTAVADGTSTDLVHLTAKTAEARTDLSAADFEVTGATLLNAVSPTTQGAALVPSTAVIDVTDVRAGADAQTFSITIAGVNSGLPIGVDVSAATGGANLASIIESRAPLGRWWCDESVGVLVGRSAVRERCRSPHPVGGVSDGCRHAGGCDRTQCLACGRHSHDRTHRSSSCGRCSVVLHHHHGLQRGRSVRIGCVGRYRRNEPCLDHSVCTASCRWRQHGTGGDVGWKRAVCPRFEPASDPGGFAPRRWHAASRD